MSSSTQGVSVASETWAKLCVTSTISLSADGRDIALSQKPKYDQLFSMWQKSQKKLQEALQGTQLLEQNTLQSQPQPVLPDRKPNGNKRARSEGDPSDDDITDIDNHSQLK